MFWEVSLRMWMLSSLSQLQEKGSVEVAGRQKVFFLSKKCPSACSERRLAKKELKIRAERMSSLSQNVNVKQLLEQHWRWFSQRSLHLGPPNVLNARLMSPNGLCDGSGRYCLYTDEVCLQLSATWLWDNITHSSSLGPAGRHRDDLGSLASLGWRFRL